MKSLTTEETFIVVKPLYITLTKTYYPELLVNDLVSVEPLTDELSKELFPKKENT